jgi:trk system potassium uptake protein TrkH
VVITLNIRPLYDSLGQSLRLGFFQVVSIISTTGFSTVDFGTWPEFSQMLLILLMLCGACAGSTAGGMKCSRVLILLRCIRRQIRQIVHPRSVSVVKLDGKVLDEDTVNSVLVFSAAFMVFTFFASLILSLDNFSFTTSLTAAITCVSNAGPGLDMVGPYGNFAAFSPLSKLVMCLCMVIGRLEIFPILVLFSRSAWKKA